MSRMARMVPVRSLSLFLASIPVIETPANLGELPVVKSG